MEMGRFRVVEKEKRLKKGGKNYNSKSFDRKEYGGGKKKAI